MELLSVPRSLLSSCGQSVTLLGILLTVFVLLVDFMKRRKTWSRYPPGPSSFPFLGSMLQIDFHRPHVSFRQLSKRFGNIFSLQICWRNLVVLNGFEVIKEALVNKSEDIADRPRLPLYEHMGIRDNTAGLVLARYGRAWKDLRRFSLSTLRNFGMGKKTLEERIIEEASFLSSAFESEEGRPFDPHFIINNAVSNVICSVTFGDRFEYNDRKFLKLLHLFEESMELGTGFLPQVLNVVPWLMHLPGPHQKVLQVPKEILRSLREIVEEHKRNWDPAHTRDFIDAFLEEIEKAKGDQETTFSELNLLFTTSDLFSAGTETTSTTLRWALLFMLLHSDIQSKVHEEIDRVIGDGRRNRRPVMEDQVNMPFTNAVIHETQRCGDIVPIALPHMAYRDTEIQGFFIPKGTVVITNLSSALKDESYWEKPHQFYPEHFLDAEGKFAKREAFLPFSAGRRVCLGEQLARMELFIFFTTLMQRFTFLIPESQPTPRLEPRFAVTSSPRPYQICAQVR
ncbi:LOW QUALITY PROTEIN: cytochrome P450 2D15-like [Rhinatrema bivittatum]|uniref:LOW QUALITY PROTEIN: cytochrome P450 2D15-like n=1 Tax=Rhinatrema bivittatum TaxID=194408 RepID=UPI001125F13B|nr:LOW QUALITY PROTEIN: cytochrome P450 2D15-like [Rhinatrema bivittatum]